jgi:hypothetical protein
MKSSIQVAEYLLMLMSDENFVPAALDYSNYTRVLVFVFGGKAAVCMRMKKNCCCFTLRMLGFRIGANSIWRFNFVLKGVMSIRGF